MCTDDLSCLEAVKKMYIRDRDEAADAGDDEDYMYYDQKISKINLEIRRMKRDLKTREQ